MRARGTILRAWAPAAGAALAGLLLGGCVVDQAHEVSLYRRVLDEHRPRPVLPPEKQPLTLATALELANFDNEQLASQGETYLQALIEKNRAFGAFLPTLSFQPNYTVEQAPAGSVAATAPGAPAESAAAAAATQGNFVQDGRVLRRFQAPLVGNLNFSFRTAPLYDAAKILVAQQRQLLLDARETLLLNVAQTYYQILISTQQVKVLQHSLRLQAARVRDLEGRLNAQLAMPLDVAQAKANESATRVQLTQALNDERNGRRTLGLLIGQVDVFNPLVPESAEPEPTRTAADYVDQADKTRPDLQAAEDAVRQARDAVKAAIREYYPSASLNVAGYLYEQNYANASKWNAILSANLPLFTAGSIRADVREAWSHLRQAALYESYLRREIAENVLTAYDNFSTGQSELADLKREVDAAHDAYVQATEQERNGLAIPLDVLTAQDSLLNAQLQYTRQAYTQTIFQLDLIRAVGDLDPETPKRLNWTKTGAAPDSE